MNNNEIYLREELSKITKLIYEKGYTSPLNGNMSLRLDDETILITPSSICKDRVTPERLLKVDMDGNVLGSNEKPSIETKCHLGIFKERKDVNAVLHSHPKYVINYSVLHKELNVNMLPESMVYLGKITSVPWLTPGSDELAEAILNASKDCDNIVLNNHGLFTAGKDIYDAFYKIEITEMLAQTQFNTELYQYLEKISKGK